MKNILIGGAWPYANGPLHLGHIAALLPGDILARYFRAASLVETSEHFGDRVFYVSGSDCHGTPVAIRARQEGRSPREVSDRFHEEFRAVFQRLGFSYDLYTKTSDRRHIGFVRDFHRKLYESEFIEPKTAVQARCPACQKLLADRLMTGTCPICGSPTRGDQCDACGAPLDADTLVEPRCAECGSALVFSETTQLFLLLSKLEPELNALLNARPHWRKNAVAFTRRYLDDGLRDRAVTRDLDWGIAVPKEGYEDKKIYIWAENVLGYLSAGAALCAERGVPFTELFGDNARHYYVHGKDNIPFHTIILPTLLLAHGEGWRLPDEIVSSEYLTLEGRKISTSRGWAVWAKDAAERYDPDALRYFLTANGPEKRDADFLWREFVEQNNTELLGAWGNLVNRTLSFIAQYAGRIVPNGRADPEIAGRCAEAFSAVGSELERARCKDALARVFALVRFGNRYFDAGEPWKTRTSAPVACDDTLFNCVQFIAALAVLLAPFLPFSSQKLCGWLGICTKWTPQIVPAGYLLPEISVLFKRLGKEVAIAETARLPR